MKLLTCQCELAPDNDCLRLATQEDLMCDICRKRGCSSITALWEGVRYVVAAHASVEHFSNWGARGDR